MQLNNDGLMWALVKEKPEEGLWMKRVPIPEVGQNDMKIKIHKTAICGTDVHIYQWNDWAQHTIPIGLTAGHEYVGEIEKKGKVYGDLRLEIWYREKDISHVENVETVWKATKRTVRMQKGSVLTVTEHLPSIW